MIAVIVEISRGQFYQCIAASVAGLALAFVLGVIRGRRSWNS